MDIWIIQNGEKVGPIHDFEVRKKIEAGELPASTPAWHDGLAAWKPLVEINLFEREFNRASEVVETPGYAESRERPLAAALPEPLFLVRRFWARWFDLYLFAGVWWITLWAAGRNIEATLMNPWVILFLYVPWFALETYLLHRIGTTPGKWLLGIRVVNRDDSLLSLADALRRSARVLTIGLGFGWGGLTLICQLMAFITAKRLGRPLWDHSGGHRITAVPVRPGRVIVYVVVLFTALQLQMIVVAPYVLKVAGETFPSLKEQLEKNPPWHLPKKS